MMNDGAIAMVTDSEQRLSVRLCAETISIAVLQHSALTKGMLINHISDKISGDNDHSK